MAVVRRSREYYYSNVGVVFSRTDGVDETSPGGHANVARVNAPTNTALPSAEDAESFSRCFVPVDYSYDSFSSYHHGHHRGDHDGAHPAKLSSSAKVVQLKASCHHDQNASNAIDSVVLYIHLMQKVSTTLEYPI
jgi:hypothetical protein